MARFGWWFAIQSEVSIVDPLFDSGILLRGIWALLEIEQPRCRWFLTGRGIEVDHAG